MDKITIKGQEVSITREDNKITVTKNVPQVTVYTDEEINNELADLNNTMTDLQEGIDKTQIRIDELLAIRDVK